MNMEKNYYFTSESVTEGHPDKICDIISDSIVENILNIDKEAKVAIETTVKNNLVYIFGEISSELNKKDCENLITKITKNVIKNIGYTKKVYGFDYKNCEIKLNLSAQSNDISLGVKKEINEEQGAGDQGLMFGFACTETEDFMPAPIHFAHKLTKKLAQIRKTNKMKYLRPDGKSQVTFKYINEIPKVIDTIVISTQHDENIKYEILKNDIIKYVINPVCKKYINEKTKIFINPTGQFIIGGPVGDSGLTGRKIIVDTYGGYSRHGGGCFSGKDPSKVDRSGAYVARWIAKNIVAANFADKCEIQISYAIGVDKPVSIYVECFGTNKIPENIIIKIINECFDLKPYYIIKNLKLKSQKYSKVASYGHFGENAKSMSWEKLNKVTEIKNKYKELKNVN